MEPIIFQLFPQTEGFFLGGGLLLILVIFDSLIGGKGLLWRSVCFILDASQAVFLKWDYFLYFFNSI